MNRGARAQRLVLSRLNPDGVVLLVQESSCALSVLNPDSSSGHSVRERQPRPAAEWHNS